MPVLVLSSILELLARQWGHVMIIQWGRRVWTRMGILGIPAVMNYKSHQISGNHAHCCQCIAVPGGICGSTAVAVPRLPTPGLDPMGLDHRVEIVVFMRIAQTCYFKQKQTCLQWCAVSYLFVTFSGKFLTFWRISFWIHFRHGMSFSNWYCSPWYYSWLSAC